jgi:hypothetical protein
MGVVRWLWEARGHVPCARGAGDVPIGGRSLARGQERRWVGLEERVASGWGECTRHESDEGTNPYEKEVGQPPSFSGICKDAPMWMDDH